MRVKFKLRIRGLEFMMKGINMGKAIALITRGWRNLGAALTLVVLTACTGTDDTLVAPVDLPSYTEEAYLIGVGDTLKIEVWGNSNLSTVVPVRPDGKISMSLIGDVLAADKTSEGLAEYIKGRLMEYIKNPQVAVIVTNPSSASFQSRVRVTGAVGSPQSVSFSKGMTVLDLILMAGGPNQFALPNEAKLYRRVAGEMKVYPIYLDDILKYGKLETNYSLVPSDIITIPERSF